MYSKGELRHLNQQTNVRILGVWGGAARVLDSASCFYIDSLKER